MDDRSLGETDCSGPTTEMLALQARNVISTAMTQDPVFDISLYDKRTDSRIKIRVGFSLG